MKGYITQLSIGNYGRFCNMMYQVAGILGIARKNGLTPVFPLLQNKDHKERFGSTEDIDVFKYFVNQLPAIPPAVRWVEKPIQWGYVDVVLPSGNWNLSGHFQSLKYFEHCIDEVRWYMRMVDEPMMQDVCGMHFRAGDYDNAYHPVLPMDYYIEAMKHFPPDQKYALFSDDFDFSFKLKMRLNERGIKYKDGQLVPSSGNYIEDWRFMKTCRHFIIGNSTFSSLAATLGEAPDKQVVAPNPWFGPKYTQITGKDIYCSDWKIVNWERL